MMKIILKNIILSLENVLNMFQIHLDDSKENCINKKL